MFSVPTHILMVFVVILTLILLITLLGVYMVIERNREKAREAQRRMFNARVKQVQQRFQSHLHEYEEARILRPKHVPQLNAICSNFFVVQGHNEDNLTYLEYISERVLQTLDSELAKSYVRNDIDTLAERIQYFISELPTRGIEFNAAFYHDILPTLLTQLTSSDLSDHEQLKDESDETEDDVDEQQEHSSAQHETV